MTTQDRIEDLDNRLSAIEMTPGMPWTPPYFDADFQSQAYRQNVGYRMLCFLLRPLCWYVDWRRAVMQRLHNRIARM